MLRVGVIGCGYWGPNLIRNFHERDDTRVEAVADLSRDHLDRIARRFRDVRTTTDADALISDDGIDAVVIATPVATHFPLAKAALEAGRHVLIEKPMAASGEECAQLNALAERARRVLMVDHTFLYTGAVRKIKEIVAAGELGDLCYFDSVRVNLGLFQHDVNVIWDLAPHDLSIMDYVLGARARSMSAHGVAHLANQHENVAYLYMTFGGSLVAHVTVNWLAPVKLRRTLICGDRKMIVFDDLQQEEKVKVYDKGAAPTTDEELHRALVDYRTGDMYAPRIETTEALSLLAGEFAAAVREERPPLTDGASGERIVRLLEAAEKSVKNGGGTENL